MSEATPLFRALVLGATGFLGSHVVRSLLARGVKVRAMRRWDSSTERLDDLPEDAVEWVVGDVLQPDSLPRCLAGCTVVVDAAGLPARGRGRRVDRAALRDAVAGVRNVMEAAREFELHRMVFVSTAATVGHGERHRRLGDEDDVRVPRPTDTPYVHLKYWMELEARKFAGLGLPVVIVNPALCLGPGAGDRPGGALLSLLARSRRSLALGGLTNVVDVRDVADAIASAAEVGQAGQRYILGGHNITLAELAEAVDTLTGDRRRRLHVPPTLAAGVRRLRRRLPGPADLPLDEEALELGAEGHYLSSRKAEHVLGLRPRPLPDTLAESGVVDG